MLPEEAQRFFKVRSFEWENHVSSFCFRCSYFKGSHWNTFTSWQKNTSKVAGYLERLQYHWCKKRVLVRFLVHILSKSPPESTVHFNKITKVNTKITKVRSMRVGGFLTKSLCRPLSAAIFAGRTRGHVALRCRCVGRRHFRTRFWSHRRWFWWHLQASPTVWQMAKMIGLPNCVLIFYTKNIGIFAREVCGPEMFWAQWP